MEVRIKMRKMFSKNQIEKIVNDTQAVAWANSVKDYIYYDEEDYGALRLADFYVDSFAAITSIDDDATLQDKLDEKQDTLNFTTGTTYENVELLNTGSGAIENCNLTKGIYEMSIYDVNEDTSICDCLMLYNDYGTIIFLDDVGNLKSIFFENSETQLNITSNLGSITINVGIIKIA